MREIPASSDRGSSGATWKNLVVLGLTTIAILGAVWGIGTLRDRGALEPASGGAAGGQVTAIDIADTAATAPKVGESAPDFSARSIAGEDIALSELQGTPVWLLFNATWCSNCRAEIPDVQTMHDMHGDRIKIISVYLSDSPSAVAQYSAALGLSFTEIADPSSDIGGLYRIMGVPTHYFIDAAGNVAAIEVGVLSEAAMTEHVQALLG